VAFDLVGRGMGVGRVIARPFVGEEGHFTRTSNRRDFALEPVQPTLLDLLKAAGHEVVGIGKIEDLFAGKGLTRAIHTTSDDHGMDVLQAELETTPRGLIAHNLVDFDTLYGHRNDIPVLLYGAGVRGGANVGTRATFADLGQTIGEVFGVTPLAHGTSFLAGIVR
jgi:phosphopentomutase